MDGLWRMDIKEESHNHPPSQNAAAYPVFRRQDIEKHRDMITRSYNAGESTRTIMAALRTKGAQCLPRNIYNFGQKIRLESLGRKAPIQWLKEELDISRFSSATDNCLFTNLVVYCLLIYLFTYFWFIYIPLVACFSMELGPPKVHKYLSLLLLSFSRSDQTSTIRTQILFLNSIIPFQSISTL